MIPPVTPTDAKRLAACAQPSASPVMYQQWRDLLFLHWRYSADAIQATLPPGLHVDTHEGQAYLGVVPFAMRRVRPRFLPAVPGLSDFLELNLRTYVYDQSGVPGVWFYSLDANQWLAVEIARRLFHLPYEHARMTMQRSAAGRIHFSSTRTGASGSGMRSEYRFDAIGTPQPASSGSLEFFLAERYRLYAHSPAGLQRGTVHHRPYPLCSAMVASVDEHLLTLNGFTPTGRAPDHVLYSPGVDVTIYPLKRIPNAPAT